MEASRFNDKTLSFHQQKRQIVYYKGVTLEIDHIYGQYFIIALAAVVYNDDSITETLIT